MSEQNNTISEENVSEQIAKMINQIVIVMDIGVNLIAIQILGEVDDLLQAAEMCIRDSPNSVMRPFSVPS